MLKHVIKLFKNQAYPTHGFKIRLHPEMQDLSIKVCMLKILRFLPI